MIWQKTANNMHRYKQNICRNICLWMFYDSFKDTQLQFTISQQSNIYM